MVSAFACRNDFILLRPTSPPGGTAGEMKLPIGQVSEAVLRLVASSRREVPAPRLTPLTPRSRFPMSASAEVSILTVTSLVSFSAVAALVLVSYLSSSVLPPSCTRRQKLTFSWLAFDALIHLCASHALYTASTR